MAKFGFDGGGVMQDGGVGRRELAEEMEGHEVADGGGGVAEGKLVDGWGGREVPEGDDGRERREIIREG